MPWWGWIVIGAVLLVAEVAIGTDFWLVFFGLSALLVGILGLAGVHLAIAVQWVIFGAAAVVMLLLFRNRLRTRFQRENSVGLASPDLIGETGVVREAVAPGARGWAEVRGTVWRIRNKDGNELPAGARVKVRGVEGVTLDVRREG